MLAVERVSIDAGEGATVEAKIGLANEGLDESALPIVVADARYTLPDGTRAAPMRASRSACPRPRAANCSRSLPTVRRVSVRMSRPGSMASPNASDALLP